MWYKRQHRARRMSLWDKFLRGVSPRMEKSRGRVCFFDMGSWHPRQKQQLELKLNLPEPKYLLGRGRESRFLRMS